MLSRHRIDLLLALLLSVASAATYAWLALPLARSVCFDYINLLFDFDPAYFVRYLTAPLADQGLNYKHPLWMIFRPLASPFLLNGWTAKESATLAMTLTAGLSVGLAYVYARLAGLGRPESGAAALWFAASSTSLFTALIPESYAWANLSLVLLWCLHLAAPGQGRAAWLARLVSAVLVAGVTISNLAQALMAELALRWRQAGWRRAFWQTALFGACAMVLLVLVLLLLQPQSFLDALQRPVQTAKEIYWQRTKGDTVGLLQLLKTYAVYSFFAPVFDLVALSPQVSMLDFRSFTFAPAVLACVLIWGMFWLFNVACGLRQRPWLAGALLATVAFNLLFHLDYQFRGSIYLYAAHLHFPLFALGLGAGPWVRHRHARWRVLYTAVLLALAAAAAWNNGLRVQQMNARMQTLELPAEAPEIGRSATPANTP
jgi:hypothetical protein